MSKEKHKGNRLIVALFLLAFVIYGGSFYWNNHYWNNHMRGPESVTCAMHWEHVGTEYYLINCHNRKIGSVIDYGDTFYSYDCERRFLKLSEAEQCEEEHHE